MTEGKTYKMFVLRNIYRSFGEARVLTEVNLCLKRDLYKIQRMGKNGN